MNHESFLFTLLNRFDTGWYTEAELSQQLGCYGPFIQQLLNLPILGSPLRLNGFEENWNGVKLGGSKQSEMPALHLVDSRQGI